MTEKTATKTKPSLSINAKTGGQGAYLKDISALSGWDVVRSPDASLSLSIEKGGLALSGEPPVMIALPVRAGKLIDILKNLARRSGAGPSEVYFGPYTLSVPDYLLSQQGQPPLRLTEKEVALIVYLAARRGGKPVTRQELLDDVWDYADNVETHTLETHIYRLRQKIEPNSATPTILVTVGEGYKLAD